jgi:ubiquinone/menaquinone biosynthesis C-methylase UbiE
MRRAIRAAQAFTSIAPFYDLLMAPVPYSQWADYVEELFRAQGCKPVRVLDLATGTGSVALHLALRGYRMTGVDKSRPMLAVARRKAKKVGVRVRWVQQDVTRLSLPLRAFDAAVCLYDSLNYVTSIRALKSVFSGVATVLKPGGLFIFDLNTPYALEREMFTQSGQVGPLRYEWKSRYNPKTRLARIRMDFAMGEKKFRELHIQRAYSTRQVCDLLESAGLLPLDAYAAYTRLPPGPRTDRTFFVACPA